MGFKILTDNDTIKLQDYNNTQFYNVSVATIKAFRSDANSFIVGRSTNGVGYWVRYINFSNDFTDLFLADYTYMTNNRSGIKMSNYTNPTSKAYGYDGSNMKSLGFNAGFQTEYVNGVVYSFCSDAYNSEWEPMVYIGVNISGNTYLNGVQIVTSITSNGGGATHIAKVTGQLKNLSSNLSDILLVSGGGGGGLIIGEDAYTGKDAGGVSGSGNNSANQSTGYAFGQGESGEGYSGGGGGLYGGYKGGS